MGSKLAVSGVNDEIMPVEKIVPHPPYGTDTCKRGRRELAKVFSIGEVG
jgi:hypothetical protein